MGLCLGSCLIIRMGEKEEDKFILKVDLTSSIFLSNRNIYGDISINRSHWHLHVYFIRAYLRSVDRCTLR